MCGVRCVCVCNIENAASLHYENVAGHFIDDATGEVLNAKDVVHLVVGAGRSSWDQQIIKNSENKHPSIFCDEQQNFPNENNNHNEAIRNT